MPETVFTETLVSRGHAAADLSRRRFLGVLCRGLGTLGLAAATGPVFAQGHVQHHQPPHDQARSSGAERGPLLAAQAIPWQVGGCAFCDMTIATPAGAPQGEGFRERTYAQWVVAHPDGAPAEAHHFESIACALNYAYVHGLRDGADATLYVTDAAGSLPASAEHLLPARRALFHWGEHLRVAMMARLIAFADAEARQAHADASPEEGRQASYRLATLEDLAPLPTMNLVALLARHTGLLEPA